MWKTLSGRRYLYSFIHSIIYTLYDSQSCSPKSDHHSTQKEMCLLEKNRKINERCWKLIFPWEDAQSSCSTEIFVCFGKMKICFKKWTKCVWSGGIRCFMIEFEKMHKGFGQLVVADRLKCETVSLNSEDNCHLCTVCWNPLIAVFAFKLSVSY